MIEYAFFHGDYSMLPSIAELELSENFDYTNMASHVVMVAYVPNDEEIYT